MIAVLGSCSGDATQPSTGAARLIIVSGAGQSDTIGAFAAADLVLRSVNAAGQAAPRTPIFVAGVFNAYIFRRAGDSTEYRAKTDTTDADGQYRMRIRFGNGADSSVFLARLMSDETVLVRARFTTRAGAPLHVKFLPRDTSVLVGDTMRIRAIAIDRFSNELLGDAALSAARSDVIAVSTSGEATARAFGRAWVRAEVRGRTDSTSVLVLPRLRVSGIVHDTVFTSFPDGSQRAFLAAGRPAPPETAPLGAGMVESMSFSPDLLTVYGHAITSNEFLFRSVAGRLVSINVQPLTPTLSRLFPRPSRDGAWLYFSQGKVGAAGLEVWRAHPDGTGAERVGPSIFFLGTYLHADPSPDGRTVVANFSTSQTPAIVLVDIASKSSTLTGYAGRAPQYSPDGSAIAYIGDYSIDAPQFAAQLMLMSPEGTSVRRVPTATPFSWVSSVDWSPDGRYLISTGRIVDVVTGESLPLVGFAGPVQFLK